MAAAKAELERLAGDVTSLRNELKEKDAQLSVAAELESKAKAQLAEAEDSAKRMQAVQQSATATQAQLADAVKEAVDNNEVLARELKARDDERDAFVDIRCARPVGGPADPGGLRIRTGARRRSQSRRRGLTRRAAVGSPSAGS